MNERPTRPVRPGGQISASDLNRSMDRLDGLSDFSGSDISSTDEFGNVILKTTIPPRTNIRILSGANPYVWEEVYLDTDGTAWQATGIRSGTLTETPAYERDGIATVAAGTVVDAAFDAGPTGGGRWLFNVAGPGSEFEPCLDDALPAATGAYRMVVQQTEDKCLATIEVAECTIPVDIYGGTLP